LGLEEKAPKLLILFLLLLHNLQQRLVLYKFANLSATLLVWRLLLLGNEARISSSSVSQHGGYGFGILQLSFWVFTPKV
jgi:hypothetical protein